MNEMYKIIEDLCQKNGVSITKMCKESNITRGSLTDLKMNRTKVLSSLTISKLSNYFSVPMSYFFGDEEPKEKTATPKDDGLSEAEIELVNLFRVFPDSEKTNFLEYTRAIIQIVEANKKLDSLRIPGVNEILLK